MKAKLMPIKPSEGTLKRGITKPEGFIEDPVERRRLVEELAGSMPELPSAEEFLKWRRGQAR
jgi:hypothetical protein